jgi:hypothetical protein
MYDVVFISYNESNAEENWKIVKSKNKYAKRIHNITGIHRAHVAAARMASTDMFYVVDGDSQLVEKFDFDYEVVHDSEKSAVHVWRSINPINDLVYGYGGVKLLPRILTLNMDTTRTDMSTSISKYYKPINIISNVTAFNTDPFNTWRSAFRECAKLSSKIIDRQKDKETIERLDIWCSIGKDKPFGEYAIKGANGGRKFGTEQVTNINLINDFNWLKEQFENYK